MLRLASHLPEIVDDLRGANVSGIVHELCEDLPECLCLLVDLTEDGLVKDGLDVAGVDVHVEAVLEEAPLRLLEDADIELPIDLQDDDI